MTRRRDAPLPRCATLCMLIALAAACVPWASNLAHAQSCSPPGSCKVGPAPKPVPPAPAPAPAPPAPVHMSDAEVVSLIARMRQLYAAGNYTLVLRMAQVLRADGVPEGMTMMGRLAYEGRPNPADYDRAADYFAEAIAKNHAEAARRLGLMHLDARWPKADAKTGLGRLSQAAGMGDAIAVYEQGKLYHDGKHVTKNPKLAAELFAKAGAAGVADADADLGEMYVRALGLPRDLAKGKLLIDKALAAGSLRAKFAKATMIMAGEDGPQSIVAAADYKESASAEYVIARRMFEEAAIKGEARAMIGLASMAMHGQGGPLDMAVAYRWLRGVGLARPPVPDLASVANQLIAIVRGYLNATQTAAMDREIQVLSEKW